MDNNNNNNNNKEASSTKTTVYGIEFFKKEKESEANNNNIFSTVENRKKLKPISDGVEPCIHKTTQPEYSLFNPILHMKFLSFDFCNLDYVPDNLKDVTESGLNQVALVAALLMTIQAPLIMDLVETPDSNAMKIPSVAIALASFLLFFTSLCFSIFMVAMLESFQSLDEVALWLKLIGWRATLPHSLFMGGLWLCVMTMMLYLLLKVGALFALYAGSGVILIYLILHAQLATALKMVYMSREKVRKGWRIDDGEEE